MASKSSIIEQEQRAYIKHFLIPQLEDGLNYLESEETALKMSLGLVGLNLQPVNPQLS